MMYVTVSKPRCGCHGVPFGSPGAYSTSPIWSMWMNGSSSRRSTPAKARRTGNPSPSNPLGADVTERTGRSVTTAGSGTSTRGRTVTSLTVTAGICWPPVGEQLKNKLPGGTAASPGAFPVADSGLVTAQILDGKATAATIKTELTARVAKLAEQGVIPGLGTILVGDDPGSRAYVGGKHRDCAARGTASIQVELPATATQAELEAKVRELNEDPACTGFIVQLPLPKHVDANAVLGLIDPAKDADGLHPISLGKLVLGQEAPLPCTPRGCVELLRRYGIPIAGKHVVVIGRGITAGRPMGLIFTRRSENATVTQCHTGTTNLAAMVRTGDIVISAAGSAGLITAGMVKPGAVLLDVGTSRNAAGKLTGDIDQAAREVASWIAPMPGGIGPMTRAMLLTNVVEAAEAGRR